MFREAFLGVLVALGAAVLVWCSVWFVKSWSKLAASLPALHGLPGTASPHLNSHLSPGIAHILRPGRNMQSGAQIGQLNIFNSFIPICLRSFLGPPLKSGGVWVILLSSLHACVLTSWHIPKHLQLKVIGCTSHGKYTEMEVMAVGPWAEGWTVKVTLSAPCTKQAKPVWNWYSSKSPDTSWSGALVADAVIARLGERQVHFSPSAQHVQLWFLSGQVSVSPTLCDINLHKSFCDGLQLNISQGSTDRQRNGS